LQLDQSLGKIYIFEEQVGKFKQEAYELNQLYKHPKIFFVIIPKIYFKLLFSY